MKRSTQRKIRKAMGNASLREWLLILLLFLNVWDHVVYNIWYSVAALQHQFSQVVERIQVYRLQQKFPNIAYYFQAKSLKPVELRDGRLAPGEHVFFGRPYFVDRWGSRYESKAFYESLEAKQFRQNFAIIGSSVAFGVSPFSSGSYADELNRLQSDIRFYNFSIPGLNCQNFSTLLNDLSQAGLSIDGVILHEAINYLPIICDGDVKARADAYQPTAYRACTQNVVEWAIDHHRPVFLMTSGLAFDERFERQELYDHMVNGQCNAYVELKLVRAHNRAMADIAAAVPGVHLLRSGELLMGRSDLFWDAVHFSERGRQEFARAMLTEMSAMLTEMSSLPARNLAHE